MDAPPNDYLILFADLIGSTEVASELPPQSFARHYISSFHWSALRALNYVRRQEPFEDEHARFRSRIETANPKGDEVICFRELPTNHDDRDLQDIAASAVAYAYVVKLYWLAAPYNLRRLRAHHFPRDIGVGLHIGPAAVVAASPESDIASLHINVAKKMEEASRSGNASRIFASLDVADRFGEWRDRVESETDVSNHPPLVYATFQPGPPIEVDGLPTRLMLCELVPTVFDSEDRDRAGVSRDRQQDFFRSLGHMAEPESGAAKASKILAENFFGEQGMFKGEDGNIKVDMELPGVSEPSEYIAYWFQGMARRSKLFMGEPWLLFNCYFLSCALMRHSAVSPVQAAGYRGIAEVLFDGAREAWSRVKAANAR